MELLTDSHPQSEATGQVLWLGLTVVALIGIGITVDPLANPTGVIALFIANLIVGWMVTASVLSYLCSGDAVLCETLSLTGDFHALTRFPVQMRLYNSSHRWPTLFLTAEIEIGTEFETLSSPPKFLGYLAPRRMVEFAWTITARRRGVHVIRSVFVRTSFPGSLIRYKYRFLIDKKVLALPAVYRLVPRARELLSGRRLSAGRYHFNPVSMEEFIGVRNYRPGDSPRNLHLILSLRCHDYPNQLVVREYEDPSEDDVCVLLDSALTETEAQDPTYLYRHEKSLSFVAALCRFLADRKYRIRFLGVEASGKTFELMLSRPSSDLPVLEARLACWKLVTNRQLVWSLLENQSRCSNASILFVSLRETAEEKRQPRLAVLSLTPDWQATLIEEVIGR